SFLYSLLIYIFISFIVNFVINVTLYRSNLQALDLCYEGNVSQLGTLLDLLFQVLYQYLTVYIRPMVLAQNIDGIIDPNCAHSQLVNDTFCFTNIVSKYTAS